jgi:uncharacterized damage-inducible protein DinB
MSTQSKPEVWLRGALPDVPPLLQPVAHSLMQSREELARTLGALTPEQIAARPNGAASVGFHARHAMGALDRLYTYARGAQLDADQQAAMAREREESDANDAAQRLMGIVDAGIERALRQIRSTPEASLLEPREVGRGRLPSTVLGLLVHGAEHTLRHSGQAVTTAKIVAAE